MYVLLGANGNITSQVARQLLKRGLPTRVVGRQAASLAPLQQLGAQTAIGDAGNAAFLAQAFHGASAIYAMIPPDYSAADMLASQRRIGSAIVQAIVQSPVPRVVNLSSIGAEIPAGTGPIAGLHEQEARLDAMAGLDLVHLRPAYFMENHLHAVGTIAAMGVYPSVERGDVPVPMIATADIATVVVRELIDTRSRGVLHLQAPRHYTFEQAATILGTAIGRPDLAYAQVEPAQGRSAMISAGFSPNVADLMVQMAQWMSEGVSTTLTGPLEVLPTTLESFAARFRQAFDALPNAPRAAA